MVVQQVLDPTHELLVLAHQIDWEAITDALRPYYHRLGRYAKPLRLMVGLHLLKHRLHLSDARVVQGLHEHLYWMTVCGIDVGRSAQAPPGTPIRFLDASTMTKWRQRLGPKGRTPGKRCSSSSWYGKDARWRCMRTDTTAQEKHVPSPTDTALLDKGRRQLPR